MSIVREEEICAYAAGIVDGEGYIGIQKNNSDQYSSPYYFVRVVVANTNLDVLEFLRLVFNGSICKKPISGVSKKQGYQWAITTHKAHNFLEKIYPYLVVKKRQATIALDFMNNTRDGEQYQNEIKKLNKGEYVV